MDYTNECTIESLVQLNTKAIAKTIKDMGFAEYCNYVMDDAENNPSLQHIIVIDYLIERLNSDSSFINEDMEEIDVIRDQLSDTLLALKPMLGEY